MSIVINEHSLLAVRRDGQVGTSSSGGGGAISNGNSSTVYCSGDGIIINGNVISANFGTTTTTVACGAHTHTLDALTDVVIATPSTGQVIQYNGSTWCNTSTTALSLTSGCPICYNGTALVSYSGGSGGGATCLDALTDVVISAPSTGHILIYCGSVWCNKASTDISANVACNQVLCYNGTTITGVTTVSCATSATNALALCGCIPTCFAAATHCHCNLYNSTNIKACTTTGGLCVCGCAYATDFVASSDLRLKTDISPIYNAISVVDRLRGVYYKLCTDGSEKCRMGMIAQEVVKVVPEVVSVGNDGMYGIDYAKLVPVLIEAVHQLQKQITNMKYGI